MGLAPWQSALGPHPIYHFRHGHGSPYTVFALSSCTCGLRFHYRAADPRRQGGCIPCTHHPSSRLSSSAEQEGFRAPSSALQASILGLPFFPTALTSMSAHSWTPAPWPPGRVILNFHRSPEHVTCDLWQGCKGRRENPLPRSSIPSDSSSLVLELLRTAAFLAHFSGHR